MFILVLIRNRVLGLFISNWFIWLDQKLMWKKKNHGKLNEISMFHYLPTTVITTHYNMSYI